MLDDGAYARNKPEKSLSKLLENTLLPQLLSRQEPLRYCVEGTSFPDIYAGLLEKAYSSWFTSTARFIRQTNRQEEFADLLPFLEKPLLFERQSCARNAKIERSFHPYVEQEFWETRFAPRSEQVRLIVLPEESLGVVCAAPEHGSAAACAGVRAVFGAYVVVLPEDYNKDFADWRASLLHEAGHTLGMGEGYAFGAIKNSPFFGTSKRRPGLMSAQMESQQKISCDEADAMIIFADALSVPGKPARTEKTARSFQSFCQDDPVWYVDGRQQKRPARVAGDERRFLQTDFTADGRVKQFLAYTPQKEGFAEAFHLYENVFAVPASQTGGMQYYAQPDGRTVVVEELEEKGYKRIFTLRDKHLLGQTILDVSSPEEVRASTLLDADGGKTRLVRVERVIRQNREDGYGIIFLYLQMEGRVKRGTLEQTSFRAVYAFKDWLMVNLIEPGSSVVTSFLLEKNPAGPGDKMQVYLGDLRQFLTGGSFRVGTSDVKALGELSARDRKYLGTYAANAAKSMEIELSSAAGSSITQLGKNAAVKPVSVQDVSLWMQKAAELYSKLGRSIQYQLDGSPFFSNR